MLLSEQIDPALIAMKLRNYLRAAAFRAAERSLRNARCMLRRTRAGHRLITITPDPRKRCTHLSIFNFTPSGTRDGGPAAARKLANSGGNLIKLWGKSKFAALIRIRENRRAISRSIAAGELIFRLN